MITVTTTQQRQSSDTPFYIFTVPLVRSTFISLVSNTPNFAEPPVFTLSEDGLVHTSVAKYVDEDQLTTLLDELFQVLPNFFADRAIYDVRNDINTVRTVSIT